MITETKNTSANITSSMPDYLKSNLFPASSDDRPLMKDSFKSIDIAKINAGIAGQLAAQNQGKLSINGSIHSDSSQQEVNRTSSATVQPT
jgi:hypothetical protein